MSSNLPTITIQTHKGAQEFPLSQFVNGERVLGDTIQEIPPGFRLVPQVVKADLRDMGQGGHVYNVGGGRVGLAAPFWRKMAERAGIEFPQDSRINETTVDGRAAVQVTVMAERIRPGLPVQRRSASVIAAYEDAYARFKADTDKKKADIRYFLARRCETAAENRATQKILGESAGFPRGDIERARGLFLCLMIVPDPTDPDAKRLLMERALGAERELYGPASFEVPPVEDAEQITEAELEPSVGPPPPVGDQFGGGYDA